MWRYRQSFFPASGFWPQLRESPKHCACTSWEGMESAHFRVITVGPQCGPQPRRFSSNSIRASELDSHQLVCNNNPKNASAALVLSYFPSLFSARMNIASTHQVAPFLVPRLESPPPALLSFRGKELRHGHLGSSFCKDSGHMVDMWSENTLFGAGSPLGSTLQP